MNWAAGPGRMLPSQGGGMRVRRVIGLARTDSVANPQINGWQPLWHRGIPASKTVLLAAARLLMPFF
jgi:hypothetical protein